MNILAKISQKNSLIRQGGLNVLGRIAASLISLGFIKYFSKEFSPTEMGIYAILDVSMTFMAMFSNFGLNQFLVRFIPEYLKSENIDAIKKTLSTFVSFTFCTNLFLVIIFFLFRNSLSELLFSDSALTNYIAMILIYAFINFYTNAIILSYQGFGDFSKVALFNFLNIFFQRVISFALILMGYGLNGVFFGFVAGSLITLIISSIGLIKYIVPFYLDFTIIKKALPYYFEGFTRYGYAQADAFIIALLFSNNTMGGFFIVNRVVYLFRLFIDSLMDPIINKLIKASEKDYYALFKKVAIAIMLICITAVLFFLFFGEFILQFISSESYHSFKTLLVVYGVSSLIFYYIYNMISIHVMIKYKPVFIFYLSALLSIFVLSFEFAFGYKYGIIGVPIGQIIGFSSVFIIVYFLFSKSQKYLLK
ncbi:MAG: oligosaccharide flippase family protein [Bacteroidia bacterium]